MSERCDKLKAPPDELFQLDQPDQDFGFHRLMHVEVTAFLGNDLVLQVKATAAWYQPADKTAPARSGGRRGRGGNEGSCKGAA
jgi:hypothetical protein